MTGQKTRDFSAQKEFLHSCCYRKKLTNHLVPAFDPMDCQIPMQADFVTLFDLLSEHWNEGILVVWDICDYSEQQILQY